MSIFQRAGIFVTGVAMAALLGVIAVFAVFVIWKNIGFAWSQADGIGMGILLVVGTICLEIAKDWLPVVYYNQRHDAPKMATFVLITFAALLSLSYASSMYWENVDGTNRASNILLFFSHAFAAGGPVVWVNASKWLEGKPTDGLPRQPLAPLPAQPRALPAPDGEQAIRNAFGEWIKARLSLIPTAKVALGEALANYTAWASANMQAQIHPSDFEFLMGEAADEAGATVVDGIYTGLWFADRDQHPLTVG